MIEKDDYKNILDSYFAVVEEMPKPIDGIQGIQRKIIYPEIAKRAGVQR